MIYLPHLGMGGASKIDVVDAKPVLVRWVNLNPLETRGFVFESDITASIMSRHREWDLQCKVYVGNLGPNAARADLETAFSKYGALKNVWVARNPPGFAFVEFEDTRDAEDAVRALDGSRLGGDRIRVEMSSGRRRNTRGGGNGGGGGGYNNGGRRGGGGRGGGRRFSPRGPRSPRRNRSRSRERTRDQRSRSRSYSRENSRSRSPN